MCLAADRRQARTVLRYIRGFFARWAPFYDLMAASILWVYGAGDVTRTFTETGKTVAHLSTGDTVRPG